MNNRIFVLIPAYQPDDQFSALCFALKARNFTVVAVDDGSGATFSTIFESVKAVARVIAHPVNRGKGATLKTGLKYIQSVCNPNDIIVTADADGQHRPEDIEKVACAAKYQRDALVLGSRAFTGRIPLKSRIGNAITRQVFAIFTHHRIQDTQTGLRAFNAELIPFMLGIRGERYEYEMNMLLECTRKRISIQETPIETVYLDGNRSSHFHPIKDAFRIYREILTFAASSFASFLTDYALFSLLSLFLGNALSNILARVVSASVNYSVNRRYVFRDRNSIAQSLPHYILLAACILSANTLILMVLTEKLCMNHYLAKIFTEVALFCLSWGFQRCFIFKNRF